MKERDFGSGSGWGDGSKARARPFIVGSPNADVASKDWIRPDRRSSSHELILDVVVMSSRRIQGWDPILCVPVHL